MFLTRASLKRRVATFVVVALVVLFGIYAYTIMPVDLLPQMNYPTITIITIYPGATPEQVDINVSKHIDQAVGAVAGVKSIESTSYNSASVIICELEYSVDLTQAKEKMIEQIEAISSKLPNEAETPVVSAVDVSGVALVSISVSGDKSIQEISEYVRKQVVPTFERINGVSRVETGGAIEQEISVLLNPYQMDRHGISQSDVTYGLSMINASIPLGETVDDNKTVSVITDNVIDTLEKLKTVPIKPLVGVGSPVLLSDIARVEVTEKKNKLLNTLNSNPNISLSIYKKANVNSIALATQIESIADDFNFKNSEISLTITDNQANFITMSLGNVWQSLVFGGFLAIGVLLVFLRSLRTSAVIGIAIPISVVATIGLMFAVGTPLNIISLGGLAIGVGMVVDNAIVVLESIYKVRQEEKLSPYESAIEGTRQVFGAIIASTLTTIAVFLPVSLIEGFTKEVFSQLSTTITFSLVASLIVAITIVPVLSVILIKDKDENKLAKLLAIGFVKMEDVYVKIVKFTLSHRILVIMLSTIMFVSSIGLCFVIGAEFMPPMDQGIVKIKLEQPNGTTMDKLQDIVYTVERALYGIPEIEYVTSSFGSLGRGKTGANLTCKLVSMQYRRPVSDVANDIRNVVNPLAFDAQVSEVKDLMNAMFGDVGSIGLPVSIGVSAKSDKDLKIAVNTIKQVVEGTSGAINVVSGLDSTSKDVKVTVNPRKAAALGLNPITISTYVRSAIDGSVPLAVMTDGVELDVRVRFDDRYVSTLQKLKQLQLKTYLSFEPTRAGILSVLGSMEDGTVQNNDISLSAVADFAITDSQSSINKKGSKHFSDVSAFVIGTTAGDVNKHIESVLLQTSLPEGVEFSFGGQQSLFAESFSGLAIALTASIIIVYAIMAVQFNSIINPLIIMFSLPLAFTGSFVGLFVLNQSLNVCSFIGLIMLVGIVVNNAIVLIDRILYLRENGQTRDLAVEEAASSRMRPILMTAMTTILGLLPLVVVQGEGTELMRPMAVVVIGGMITSTLLSLVVIPAIYSLITPNKSLVSSVTEK